jgi:hypothetical protein
MLHTSQTPRHGSGHDVHPPPKDPSPHPPQASSTPPPPTTLTHLDASPPPHTMATTGRTLGRGRVLGSAHLAPTPSQPSSSTSASASAANGLLSPSESTTSLPSQVSSSPALTPQPIPGDLAANVSVGTAVAAASGSSRLVCPICNEEMVRSSLYT